MKICSECGAEASTYAKFCKSCGSNFYIECPKCGRELEKTATFCESCGAKCQKDDDDKFWESASLPEKVLCTVGELATLLFLFDD